jgi:hypothetical protein
MAPPTRIVAGLGVSVLLLSAPVFAQEPTAAPPATEAQPETPAPTTETPSAAPSVLPGKQRRGGTKGALETGWWWDLNLEGGFGFRSEPNDNAHLGFGLGRVRAGATYMAEPWYLSLGPTYEYSNFSKATFGLQAEMLFLWAGTWAQVGGLYDIEGNPGFMAAAGYSLIGIEYQTRSTPASGPARWAVFAKLRLPISWLLQIGKGARIPKESE